MWREGLSWWLSNKESICQCRRLGFDFWIGKIHWRRKWIPTSVFLPGKSHGLRSLVGSSPEGCKESDMTERLNSNLRRCGQKHALLASILGSCSSPFSLTFLGARSRAISQVSVEEKNSFSRVFFPLLIFVSILQHYFPNHILHNTFIAMWGRKSVLCPTPRESQNLSMLMAMRSPAVKKKPSLALF